ncbi:MAG: amidophosphoribosyltransferase [Brevinematales bacterium]|nr:amidophosphoribosyltransferase [Brevinematales bacterium]
MFDGSGEKCGIVGIYGKIDGISDKLFKIMNALQHRGQEGAGIVFNVDNNTQRIVVQGLVKDLFSAKEIKQLEFATSVIGHIRYSTTGFDDISNIQPFISKTIDGKTISLAHNGNITNALEIRNKLMKEGHTFSTTTDSEVMLHHIVKEYNRTINILHSVESAIREFEGAFSIIMLFGDSIIAFRDKYGFRPLVFGLKDGIVFFASEDSALKSLDVFQYEEVLPGEVVLVNSKGMRRKKVTNNEKLSHCIFELVYFSKPSSNVFGESVYKFRYRCGVKLAEYDEGEYFDGIIPIPDSGMIAGLGYSDKKGIPIVMGLIRSHFIGRSFIQPNQDMRDDVVKAKFFVPTEIVEGKRLVLIDDSIVRGTTMKRIVELLRKNGVKEIHLRIASPPVKYPCYFGIDFPSQSELIANQKTINEIRDYLNVDSIKYLEVEDMMSLVKESNSFCNACFSGIYKQKTKQLSKDIFEVRR